MDVFAWQDTPGSGHGNIDGFELRKALIRSHKSAGELLLVLFGPVLGHDMRKFSYSPNIVSDICMQ